MFDFLAGVLAELYKIWPSFGGAIVLFTAIIMLVLSPLSIKSTRSMIAMQRVGPEIKKLQQKHKGDREALNREMMAFYQENNINPFSSCLPLLLQMPVFIVLYQVLIGLTRRSDGALSNFDPKYLEGENTPLAVALRGTNEMMSFGMDLSQSAWSELRTEGLVTALPFVILVGLVVITAIVQQRQVQGRNPSASANPQQQMIAKVMPFIFVPISVSIPAGVVIYFVVSNLVRIGQQFLVTRLDFRGDPSVKGGDDGDKKRSSKALRGKGDKGGAIDAKSTSRNANKDGSSNGKSAKTAANKTTAKNNNQKGNNQKGDSTRGNSAKGGTAKGGTAKSGTAKSGTAKSGTAKSGTAKSGTAKPGTAKSSSGRVNGTSRTGGPTGSAPRPRKRKKKRR